MGAGAEAGAGASGAAASAGMGDTMSTLLGNSAESAVNSALRPKGPNMQPMTPPPTSVPGTSSQQSDMLQKIIKQLQMS